MLILLIEILLIKRLRRLLRKLFFVHQLSVLGLEIGTLKHGVQEHTLFRRNQLDLQLARLRIVYLLKLSMSLGLTELPKLGQLREVIDQPGILRITCLYELQLLHN